jgi:hypothetical protein
LAREVLGLTSLGSVSAFVFEYQMPFSLRHFHAAHLPPEPIQRLMRALVAISLANLCYLRIWDVLLHHPERNYLAATPYQRVDYTAAVIGAGLLAVGLYFLIQVVWQRDRRWLRAIAMLTILVVFLLPLDFVRRSSGLTFEGFAGGNRYLLIIGVSAGLLLAALVFRQRFYAGLFWLLALLSPYAVVNLVYALANVAFPGKESPRTYLPGKAVEPGYVAKNRVVWIIFDEWDQAAIFDRRPADVKLPVLDEFVKQSVVATQAFPPAGQTLTSLSALLLGLPVSTAVGRGDSELRFKCSGEDEWRDFRASDTIISETLRAGKKVAVLGWYHPYERILPASPNLTVRSWGFPAFQGFRRSNVLSAVAAQYGFLALPQFGRMITRDLYADMHAAALAAVADPSVDFVFLHYGIPHKPGIYNLTEHRLSTALRSSTAGYYGNLALADRTLGELSAEVGKAGLRASTAFILTSDHWWRSSPWIAREPDYRVPLVIRARNDGPAARVSAPLCTVNLPGLVSKMLEGAVFDNAGVVGWLEQKHGPVPVGYIKGVAQWPKPSTVPAQSQTLRR